MCSFVRVPLSIVAMLGAANFHTRAKILPYLQPSQNLSIPIHTFSISKNLESDTMSPGGLNFIGIQTMPEFREGLGISLGIVTALAGQPNSTLTSRLPHTRLFAG